MSKKRNSKKLNFSETKEKAIKDLKDFFASRESVIFLRLLAGSILSRGERYGLIVDSIQNEQGQFRVIYLINDCDSPFLVTLLRRKSVNIGDFLFFDDIRMGNIIPSHLPITIEMAIKDISERGIIPLDKIVDWICERLVSE